MREQMVRCWCSSEYIVEVNGEVPMPDEEMQGVQCPGCGRPASAWYMLLGHSGMRTFNVVQMRECMRFCGECAKPALDLVHMATGHVEVDGKEWGQTVALCGEHYPREGERQPHDCEHVRFVHPGGRSDDAVTSKGGKT